MQAAEAGKINNLTAGHKCKVQGGQDGRHRLDRCYSQERRSKAAVWQDLWQEPKDGSRYQGEPDVLMTSLWREQRPVLSVWVLRPKFCNSCRTAVKICLVVLPACLHGTISWALLISRQARFGLAQIYKSADYQIVICRFESNTSCHFETLDMYKVETLWPCLRWPLAYHPFFDIAETTFIGTILWMLMGYCTALCWIGMCKHCHQLFGHTKLDKTTQMSTPNSSDNVQCIISGALLIVLQVESNITMQASNVYWWLQQTAVIGARASSRMNECTLGNYSNLSQLATSISWYLIQNSRPPSLAPSARACKSMAGFNHWVGLLPSLPTGVLLEASCITFREVSLNRAIRTAMTIFWKCGGNTEIPLEDVRLHDMHELH